MKPKKQIRENLADMDWEALTWMDSLWLTGDDCDFPTSEALAESHFPGFMLIHPTESDIQGMYLFFHLSRN